MVSGYNFFRELLSSQTFTNVIVGLSDIIIPHRDI